MIPNQVGSPIIVLIYWSIVFYVTKCSFAEEDLIFDSIDLSHFGAKLFGTPNETTGDVIKAWETTQNREINPEELGSYIEGDILIPRPMGKNGILAETYRWPGGIVPFEIRGKFSGNDIKLIEEAINTYHKHTCVKFVPHKNEKDFIIIQNSQSGCWSSVGKVGGRQIVNLQTPGCVHKIGTVIHELMHAIGFLHEQNREERDDHVIIQFQNVQRGMEQNFEKAPKSTTSNFGVVYDFGSVMHYSAKAFSVNGKPTIIPKYKTSDTMGQREGFSEKDIQKIWKMYNCKGTTSSSGYKNGALSSSEFFQNVVGEFLNTVFSNGDEEEMEKV